MTNTFAHWEECGLPAEFFLYCRQLSFPLPQCLLSLFCCRCERCWPTRWWWSPPPTPAQSTSTEANTAVSWTMGGIGGGGGGLSGLHFNPDNHHIIFDFTNYEYTINAFRQSHVKKKKNDLGKAVAVAPISQKADSLIPCCCSLHVNVKGKMLKPHGSIGVWACVDKC